MVVMNFVHSFVLNHCRVVLKVGSRIAAEHSNSPTQGGLLDDFREMDFQLSFETKYCIMVTSHISYLVPCLGKIGYGISGHMWKELEGDVIGFGFHSQRSSSKLGKGQKRSNLREGNKDSSFQEVPEEVIIPFFFWTEGIHTFLSPFLLSLAF